MTRVDCRHDSRAVAGQKLFMSFRFYRDIIFIRGFNGPSLVHGQKSALRSCNPAYRVKWSSISTARFNLHVAQTKRYSRPGPTHARDPTLTTACLPSSKTRGTHLKLSLSFCRALKCNTLSLLLHSKPTQRSKGREYFTQNVLRNITHFTRRLLRRSQRSATIKPPSQGRRAPQLNRTPRLLK